MARSAAPRTSAPSPPGRAASAWRRSDRTASAIAREFRDVIAQVVFAACEDPSQRPSFWHASSSIHRASDARSSSASASRAGWSLAGAVSQAPSACVGRSIADAGARRGEHRGPSSRTPTAIPTTRVRPGFVGGARRTGRRSACRPGFSDAPSATPERRTSARASARAGNGTSGSPFSSRVPHSCRGSDPHATAGLHDAVRSPASARERGRSPLRAARRASQLPVRHSVGVEQQRLPEDHPYAGGCAQRRQLPASAVRHVNVSRGSTAETRSVLAPRTSRAATRRDGGGAARVGRQPQDAVDGVRQSCRTVTRRFRCR